jgi:predicted nucleic acid-binding protein
VSDFFFDSSALVKRYPSEQGTIWVREIVERSAGHTIWIAEITEMEAAAALAARQRALRGITRQERDATVALLARHCTSEYQLILCSRPILDTAIELTQRHRLRGYDAVQLATALAASAALRAAGLPSPAFVAADTDLLAAARAKGLASIDPNLQRGSLEHGQSH